MPRLRQLHLGFALTLGLVLGILALLWLAPQAGLARPGSLPAADPVIGGPIPISTLSIDETAPAVAYDSVREEFLVVWHNYRQFSDDDIYAQRVSTHGGLLSWFNVDVNEQAPLTGDRNCPAVAYSSQDGDYLVVYSRQDTSGRWDVMGMRVNLYGPQGDEFTIAISTTMPNASEDRPVVAYNSVDDNYLVAWVQQGTKQEIWGQLVAGAAGGGDMGGETISTTHNLTAPLPDNCGSPDLAYHSGRNSYALAFNYSPAGDTEALVRLISANGVYSTGQQTIVDLDGEQPAVAANAEADQYVVVYKYMGGASYSEIWVFRTSGSLSGVVRSNLTPSPSDDQVDPEVARLGDSNLYQAVWSEQHPGGRGVRGIRFTAGWDLSPAFDIHMESGDLESVPAVADGFPTTLAVWEHDGVSTEIFGRLLGHRVYLPLVLRNYFP